MAKAASLTILLLVTGYIGYLVAHSEVARECERLGSFYVGKQTFHCEVKK
jgi:uncharacterized membrane protein (UPF0136 family)